MKKNAAWIVAVVVVIAVVASIVLRNNTADERDHELTIGAILPMTSWAAYVGESSRMGIELAVRNQQEADSGLEVSLVVEDSANDPKTALAANRKLRDVDGASIVFCVMSSVAEAVLTQAPDAPTLLSVVSHSRVTADRPRTYRYFLSSDKETRAMAEFLAARGASTAAFLYVNDDFGLDAAQCFRQYFDKVGGKVVFEESFDKAGNQVSDIVAKSISATPDAVFFAGYGAPMALIAQRLRESEYQGLVCAFSSFSASTVLKQAGDAAEGVFVSTTGYDPTAPQSPAQRQFVDAFQAAYGSLPDHYAAYCYDLTSIFLECWQDSGNDLEEALRLMGHVSDHSGAIGRASCNDERDFEFPVVVKVVSQGQLQAP